MPRLPSRTFVLGCATGLLGGAALLFAGLLVAGLVLQDRLVREKTERLAPPFAAGEAAPLDWTVTSSDGYTLELARLAGRPIFLHFWRPSCMSCLSELEPLNRLYESLPDPRIAFVSVALDRPEELPALALQHDLSFPLYRPANGYPEAIALRGTPTVLVVAPNGRVVYRHENAANWDAPGVRALLEALLPVPAE